MSSHVAIFILLQMMSGRFNLWSHMCMAGLQRTQRGSAGTVWLSTRNLRSFCRQVLYDQNRNAGTFVIILNDFYICSMIIPLSSCLLHIAGALGASITFNSSSKLNYPIFTTWQCVGKLLFWIPQELYTNYTLKTITYNIIIGFTYQAQAVDIISVSSNSLRDLGWDQASDCPLKLCITHSQSRTRTVFTVKHDMTPKLWALLVYFCHCRHFQCQYSSVNKELTRITHMYVVGIVEQFFAWLCSTTVVLPAVLTWKYDILSSKS